jgi:hypothetical protein
VNDWIEGEGVVREFATGSTTSSRVIELISNQASEMFQARELFINICIKADETFVVITLAALRKYGFKSFPRGMETSRS